MRTLIIILTLGSVFFGLFSASTTRGAHIDLTFQGDVLSANLKEIPLRDILEKLEAEKGVSWTGNSSIGEKKITRRFKDLSLEDGMKRILASMDYCLIFDSNERLASVIIIGEKIRGKVMPNTRIVAQNKRTQQTHTAKTNKTREVSNGPPAVNKKDHDGFRVIRNIPSTIDVSEPTAEEVESLKVRKNLPPPGSAN